MKSAADQGWISVPEVDYNRWKETPKPFCDTASSSSDVVITCVCQNEIRIQKSAYGSAVICKQCGRVYRVKESRSYVVEEYLGKER